MCSDSNLIPVTTWKVDSVILKVVRHSLNMFVLSKYRHETMPAVYILGMFMQ